jgi:hypothetical protein
MALESKIRIAAGGVVYIEPHEDGIVLAFVLGDESDPSTLSGAGVPLTYAETVQVRDAIDAIVAAKAAGQVPANGNDPH